MVQLPKVGNRRGGVDCSAFVTTLVVYTSLHSLFPNTDCALNVGPLLIFHVGFGFLIWLINSQLGLTLLCLLMIILPCFSSISNNSN